MSMVELNTIDSIKSPRIQKKFRMCVFLVLFIPFVGPYSFLNLNNGEIVSICLFVLWVLLISQYKDAFVKLSLDSRQKKIYLSSTVFLVVVFAAISATSYLPIFIPSFFFILYWSESKIKVLFH